MSVKWPRAKGDATGTSTPSTSTRKPQRVIANTSSTSRIASASDRAAACIQGLLASKVVTLLPTQERLTAEAIRWRVPNSGRTTQARSKGYQPYNRAVCVFEDHALGRSSDGS